MVKQVIVVRKDLQMSPGKTAAQVAHAAIGAYEKAPWLDVDEWKRDGVTKIVLRVPDRKTLLALHKKAVAKELPVCLICDEGRTEVEPGSFTCLAIGPAPVEEIDTITGSLPLL